MQGRRVGGGEGGDRRGDWEGWGVAGRGGWREMEAEGTTECGTPPLSLNLGAGTGGKIKYSSSKRSTDALLIDLLSWNKSPGKI